MKGIIKIISLTALIILSNNSKIFAQEERKNEDEKGIFSVVLENDILAGTDGGYTNGIRLAYISPETNMPEFVRNASHYLPMLAKDGKKRISFAVGQNMYTPADITVENPNPNDRPYAGWLYGSFGIVSDTRKTLDNVLLTIGMVGPSAQAGETQRMVHKAIDSRRPRGWDHQLHDELGIILTYERKWREVFHAKQFGVEFDVMPHVGINLGNVNTDASVGATFRLGSGLPADYGPPRIRPSLPGSDFFIPTQKLGGYLFATFEGRAVARNIFLDGNTFRESPHVHKNTTVGSLQLGTAITWDGFRISYTHIFMTKEYKGQADSIREFDAITLSWRL